MVRNYVRKGLKIRAYTQEQLEVAVSEVKNGTKSLKQAAEEYKIPKPTLCQHVKGWRGQKSKTRGRCPIVSKQ